MKAKIQKLKEYGQKVFNNRGSYNLIIDNKDMGRNFVADQIQLREACDIPMPPDAKLSTLINV